jgi:hypothetical protein
MRQLSYLLLVAVMAGLGCTPPSFLRNDPPPQVEMKPPPAPPAVLPDSVNEKNADERARCLREELEYDAARKPAAGPVEKN